MGSLQDALRQTGLVDEERERRARKARASGSGRGGKAPAGKSGKGGSGPGRSQGQGNGKGKGKGGKPGTGKTLASTQRTESDLARAYAARQRAEKDERERVRQERLADQEARRKRNLQLDGIVSGQALNRDDAEIPRYFQHLGRIRRVLCTAEQRQALNAGELGIVSLRGRYLIVAPDILAQYRELAPDLVPDLAGAEPEDPGDYPPVPDDLAW